MYIKLNEQNYKDYFAHTCENKPKENLIEHCNLTKFYLEKIIETKNLSKLIDDMIINLDKDNFTLIKKIFYNAIYLHDLGKTNPSFQANKMNNKLFKKTTSSSNHSDHSVKQFIEIFSNQILTEDEKLLEKLIYILNTFSYSILKHHGKLSSLENFETQNDNYENFKNDLIKCANNSFDSNDYIENINDLQNFINNSFNFYILNKFLFSLLISSDYYATTHYMADLPTEDFGIIKDTKKIIDKFENYKIVQNIRQHKNQHGINALRSKMFLEAEHNLLKNIDKNIFYLEAPTGSGKTLTSINLAMKLLEKEEIDKIFYVFPFNTLIEQTKKTLSDIFEDELNIEVINSITPIKHANDNEQENEESKYQQSYMNRLFFHNELILTTHIALFNILFGTTKEENFPLWQLANSVIILDEIQSYNIDLWSYMTKFFKFYATALNIKFIIMSATLPKLDELIDGNKDIFTQLITNKDEYYKNSFFKDRVKIDFSLLELKNINDEILIEKLNLEKDNYSKILFEFIKKDSAREFYNKIREDERFNKDFEIYELSGDDNKASRELVIRKIKDKNLKIILVATQVIEAGVDIDMDLGFKDISTLDSEEQFLGRINRSCLNTNLTYKPKVYFFNKDDENTIYKDDTRVQNSLRKEEAKDMLLNKDFKSFYDSVLKEIRKKGQKIEQGVNSNFEKFDEDVVKLNYANVKNKMQLIKNKNFRLFFPFELDISDFQIDEFKNLHKDEFKIYLNENGKLDGQKVWNEFLNLNDIKNYAKKEIKRSEINSLMQFFTFNIINYDNNTKPPHFNDEKFGFYFVEDYENYITQDKKFNRKEYLKSLNGLFICD